MRKKTLLALSLMTVVLLAQKTPVPPTVASAAKDILPSASTVGGIIYELAIIATVGLTAYGFIITGTFNVTAFITTILAALVTAALVLGSIALLEYLRGK